MEQGYPFIFQMNDKSDSDNLLLYVLQYRFKSGKSHHTYIVRIEKYIKHTYCLKFFDKANMDSKNKFSLRTNTFEPRTIMYTLFHIVEDVLKKDPYASFFFIGAEDEKDVKGLQTRRFTIYQSFVLSIVGDKSFEHLRLAEYSLYILLNKKVEKEERQLIVDGIVKNVKNAFA